MFHDAGPARWCHGIVGGRGGVTCTTLRRAGKGKGNRANGHSNNQFFKIQGCLLPQGHQEICSTTQWQNNWGLQLRSSSCPGLGDRAGVEKCQSAQKTKRELPPEPFRARFRSLGKVYCRKGSALLPGDLENGKKLWSDAKVLKAFEAEPFLEYMCVCA